MDAQPEADRLNQACQAVIGAKEGATKVIVAKVGSAVTDAMLRTPDGVDYKGVDEYELCDVADAAILGADRPATTDILALLSGIITYAFDFCKKVDQNVEVLRLKAGRMKSHGITMDNAQLALIILANIKIAAKEEYGSEFRPALQVIRRKFKYNHVHDERSIAYIMQTCAGADQVRQLTDAPPPRADNSVANAVLQLTQLLQEPMQSDDEYYETDGAAAAATLDSKGLDDNCSRRGRKKKKKTDQRGERHSKSRGRDENKKKNLCKHCRRFDRWRQHLNIPAEQCFYNQKYKRWRPRLVCDEMDIPFKPRDHFPAETSGASDLEESGASESS